MTRAEELEQLRPLLFAIAYQCQATATPLHCIGNAEASQHMW